MKIYFLFIIIISCLSLKRDNSSCNPKLLYKLYDKDNWAQYHNLLDSLLKIDKLMCNTFFHFHYMNYDTYNLTDKDIIVLKDIKRSKLEYSIIDYDSFANPIILKTILNKDAIILFDSFMVRYLNYESNIKERLYFGFESNLNFLDKDTIIQKQLFSPNMNDSIDIYSFILSLDVK